MPPANAYPMSASEQSIVADLLGLITANGTTVNVGKKGKPTTIAGTPATIVDVNQAIITYPDGSKYKISLFAEQLNKSAGIA